LWTRVQEAKRRGAKLIAIDPYRSQTAAKCHEHVALLPGTDAALALGMMHVLIAEDLVDHDYIARYTIGFDALRERAAEFSPERVARICGIASETVIALARLRHDPPGVVSITACSAMPAAATPCVQLRACRHSSAPGANLPAAHCSRRPAASQSTSRRSSAPTSLRASRERST
jgi:anaerobic selenocysteine-containing dehydrogenase